MSDSDIERGLAMTTDGSLFASAIEHHLELKRRNQHLDEDLPLDEFIGDDPFANHPLFKTEADARREEEETGEHPVVAAQALEPPPDTLSMPAVTTTDEPLGWMETKTASDFSWD
jgi:hypothetical protein